MLNKSETINDYALQLLKVRESFEVNNWRQFVSCHGGALGGFSILGYYGLVGLLLNSEVRG